MSAEDVSSNQGGDAVNQASSQPKIISNDETVQQNTESLKQDKDDNGLVPSGTILSNQVVGPMSRGNDNYENPTTAAKANMGHGEEAKTSTKGGATSMTGTGKFSKNFTRENLSKGCCRCGVIVCAACCDSLLCIPCIDVDMVLTSLLCPVVTAINCCCPL